MNEPAPIPGEADTEPLPVDLANPRPIRRGLFPVVSVGLLAVAVTALAVFGASLT